VTEGTESTSEPRSLNFTAIWSPSFDRMEVEEVLAELRAASNITEEVTAWFDYFFGEEGLVTAYFRMVIDPIPTEEEEGEPTAAPAPETSGSGAQDALIPEGMEEIVAWITKNVEREIKRRCPECEVPPTNSTPSGEEPEVPEEPEEPVVPEEPEEPVVP